MNKTKRRTSRKIGLLGYPLSHTLSPVFQQAALDYYNLPITYEVWEVAPEQLGEAVARLRLPECLGANVTIPYKEAVIPHLDQVVDFAARVGAVNTILNRDGKLTGLNTDGPGFLRALEEDGCYDPDGKRIALVGAGGAARAVAAALLGAGAFSVVIFNRDIARARTLADALRRDSPEAEIAVEPLERRTLAQVLPEIDLVVNTTPVGMKNGPRPADSAIPDDLLPDGAFVVDLVYNPPVTRLLSAAQAKGLQTLNGLSMLVYQGAAAFEVWTGEKAPLGLMFERIRQALNY